jgi:hypothetical protein
MIIFQMSGSGMAIRYGEYAAQALKAIKWRDYVYWAFNLAPDFAFDAIFIAMGTNDIKLLVDGKVLKKKISVNGELRDEILPMSIGEFVSKIYSKTLREFVDAFTAPCCWFGGGFGGTPASQIAVPQNKRFLVTALADPQRIAALGRLFNTLNLYVARVAKQCF